MELQSRNAMIGKNKFILLVAEIRLRLARGQSWVYDVKNALVIAASLKILFSLSLLQTIFAMIAALFFFLIVGIIDYDFLKFVQKENELLTSKYNAHLNKIK